MIVSAFNNDSENKEEITLIQAENCDELRGELLGPKTLKRCKLIKYKGKTAGFVIYSKVGTDKINMTYITIFEEFRRNKIASKVVDMITDNGNLSYYGVAMESGFKFWDSMGVTMEEPRPGESCRQFYRKGKRT